MSEVDPDPYEQEQGRSVLGGAPVPDEGDPTDGGRRGQVGEVPSIAADEPGDGASGYPVGGGDITEDQGGRMADPDPGA